MTGPRLLLLIVGGVVALRDGPAPSRTAAAREEIPACKVDLSKDTVMAWPVPAVDFRREILPSIDELALKQSQAFQRFAVPITTVWKVSGLNLLFPDAIHPCCPYCRNQGICADSVVFEIVNPTGDRVFDRFLIHLNNVRDPTYKIANNANESIELAVDTRGTAVIAPGHVHLFFRDRPDLHLGSAGKTIFADPVYCIASQPQWAVIAPDRYPNPPKPYRPLYVDPH